MASPSRRCCKFKLRFEYDALKDKLILDDMKEQMSDLQWTVGNEQEPQ